MAAEYKSGHSQRFVVIGALVSPLLSTLDASATASGFVADALNDCSKSAMMSSMCSVPTEIRRRSCKNVSVGRENRGKRKQGKEESYIRHSRRCLLFVAQLLVRRGPRMDRHRLRVTDIGQI